MVENLIYDVIRNEKQRNRRGEEEKRRGSAEGSVPLESWGGEMVRRLELETRLNWDLYESILVRG